jgi:hypothetical protein
LKILQTSPRIQASIPALAIIIGVITTFLMHASIFGRGSAWRESLLTAAGALFIAAFVLVVAYVGSGRVVIFLLGLPFVGTDVMLFVLSVAAGGNPESFASEGLTGILAILIGWAVGGIVKSVGRSNANEA